MQLNTKYSYKINKIINGFYGEKYTTYCIDDPVTILAPLQASIILPPCGIVLVTCFATFWRFHSNLGKRGILVDTANLCRSKRQLYGHHVKPCG